MTVYVDTLEQWLGAYHDAQAASVAARNGGQWCHMFAQDETELHAFARSIGLRRQWYHGSHYDLTPWRRTRAIRRGAIPVTRREGARLRIAWRAATQGVKP